MGRYILCGKEADLPYEVDELDLRIYTIEELCYYIYHNLALIGDDFIDDRLLGFIGEELECPEIAEKIRRFYVSPSDQDATLQMIITEVGYYTDIELQEFQQRLVRRRRKNGPERVLMKADALAEKKRYESAIRFYELLALDKKDGRITKEFSARVWESMANCYGKLYAFDRAMECLGTVYEMTREERILVKMYELSVLSGLDLPEDRFFKVPDAKLQLWQQNYWNKETIVKGTLEENETMQIFLHDKDRIAEELRSYVETEKELLRGMLE